MRHGAFGLGHLQPVACRAHRRFRLFHQLAFRRLRAVDAVARDAREIAALVPAAFPSRVSAAVVARQARLVHLRGLHLPELQDVPLGVIVHVRLAGAVAALAAVGGRGRAWFFASAWSVPLSDVALVFVAHEAGVAAGITRRRCLRRRRRLCLRKLRTNRTEIDGGGCTEGQRPARVDASRPSSSAAITSASQRHPNFARQCRFRRMCIRSGPMSCRMVRQFPRDLRSALRKGRTGHDRTCAEVSTGFRPRNVAAVESAPKYRKGYSGSEIPPWLSSDTRFPKAAYGVGASIVVEVSTENFR